jgi:HAD superfamily hydrolase (TIGR01484 family)
LKNGVSDVMSDIRLIATDLDGTLVGHTADFGLYEELREKFIEYRRKSNTVWATCTGRSLASTKQFLGPMEDFGIRPHYIIVSHAYIYEHTKLGYVPHLAWNFRMRRIFRQNSRDIRRSIDKWYKTITAASLGVVTVYRRKTRLRMRFRTEEAAIVIERMLEKESSQHAYLRVVRRSREIDVFQLPFSKGLAVSELAGHLLIDRSDILTIGDGYNDISMLDQSVAEYSACPSNAEPEVQYLVHRNGGHIAAKAELAGVVEILNAHLDDKINSELPEGWQPSEPQMSSRQMSDATTIPHTGGFSRSLLFALVSFTVLLVVAWFNVIPFSHYILMPFYFLIKVVEKFVNIFI